MQVLGVVAIAIIAIDVAACGSGSLPTETDTATAEAKADVAEAYLDYWELITELETRTPTQDPELTQHANGAALAAVVSDLATLEHAGQIRAHGPAYKHKVLVVELDGDDAASSDEATVQDCFIDDTTVLDRVTLEPVSDEESAPVARLLEATVVDRGGVWQVRTIETLDASAGSTPASCADTATG